MTKNHKEGQKRLSDLLENPGLIASLEQAFQPKETLSKTEWALVDKILHKVKPLLTHSLELDSKNPNKLYTLEIGADNGILFAYQNNKDPLQTTVIYLSSYGKEFADWDEGLQIKPERVLCHSIKIISKRQIAPHIFTASEFNMRISADFRFVEGDPDHSEELQSRGMYTNDRTFLGNFTKHQMLFIEVDDPIAEQKKLAPLLNDAKDLLRLALDANRGEIFWRLLTGKLEEDDLAIIEDFFVGSDNEEVVIDMQKVSHFTKEIAQGLIAKYQATMRTIPITEEYLKDLAQRLSTSSPIEVTRTMLPNDYTGIGIKRLLEKRAKKKLGNWKKAQPIGLR